MEHIEQGIEDAHNLKEISISATEPTADEVLWVKRGKNLIDFSKCMMGQELHSSTGDWAINPEYYTTDYIRVQAGRTYTSSGLSTPNRAYYDKNFNYLCRTMTETAIAPENSYYTKLVSLIEGYSTPQLEEGSVATDYEPYIETTVNVKENGSFSEILNVDEVKNIIETATPFTANEGYTIDLQYMNKQGKHYWGTIVLHKNSGTFGNSEIPLKCNVGLAQIFTFGCFLGINEYSSLAVGYLHLRANQDLYVGDNNNTSKYNYARFFIDFVSN